MFFCSTIYNHRNLVHQSDFVPFFTMYLRYERYEKTIVKTQPDDASKCCNPYHKNIRNFRKQIRYLLRKAAKGRPHSGNNFCKTCQLTIVTSNDIQNTDARDYTMECNCCVEEIQQHFTANTPITERMIRNNNNLSREVSNLFYWYFHSVRMTEQKWRVYS